MSILFFILFNYHIEAQTGRKIKFSPVSKINTLNFGKGIVYDGTRLFVTGNPTSNILTYNFEPYFVYFFKRNKWEDFKYSTKSFRKRPSFIAEFLPDEKKIVTIGNPFQILDISTLQVNDIKIDGDYPVSCGTAVWRNKIYFFGGFWTSSEYDYLTKNYIYSCTNRFTVFDQFSFKELAPMPTSRSAKGKFINDKLYVLGGDSLQTKYDEILQYDPLVDSWQTIGHLPHPVYDYAIANSDQLIYLLGIYNDQGFLGIYNPTSNGYKEYSTNLPRTGGSLTLHENKLYFFAGVDPSIRVTDPKLYLFDLDLLPQATEFICSDN